jgi:hypothetical protein
MLHQSRLVSRRIFVSSRTGGQPIAFLAKAGHGASRGSRCGHFFEKRVNIKRESRQWNPDCHPVTKVTIQIAGGWHTFAFLC